MRNGNQLPFFDSYRFLTPVAGYPADPALTSRVAIPPFNPKDPRSGAVDLLFDLQVPYLSSDFMIEGPFADT